MNSSGTLAPLLERFFVRRLMQQRQASPHTISSYRDTFCQLLTFLKQRLHRPPSQLCFEDVTAPVIGSFLNHIEKHDAVSIRTCNLRLTAIHSFFRYAAFEVPDHSEQIQRVIAIPSKRFTRTIVSFSRVLMWTRFSPLPIGVRGSDGAITPSSLPPRRLVFASRR